MIYSTVERITGRDRWPETEATVTSSSVASDGGFDQGFPAVRVAFRYSDSTGELHYGSIYADSMTSIYNLKAGDTFSLRFDPNAPKKFYCPEASSLDIRTGLYVVAALLAIAVVIITQVRSH